MNGSTPQPVLPAGHAPFLRAPEASGRIFLVIFAAACAPLAAGTVFFGWRALLVAGECVAACVVIESVVYGVLRTPSLLGRSHAALTGLLLALTLPPHIEWYVPLAGSLFAIVVGKALFGGVGHFLWQPALLGRMAVAVIFAPPLWAGGALNQTTWPLLARERAVLGDAASAKAPAFYRQWRGTPPPDGADAFLLSRPDETLRQAANPLPDTPAPLGTLRLGEEEVTPPGPLTSLLRRMPPPWDLLCGARAGGIGETCVLVILVAGLYLVYRNYVRGNLPGLFLLAAAATAAIAPTRAGPDQDWQWFPLVQEGLDAGLTYVTYHLASGELMLAAWFFATEMTSRPVTAPAQAVFGLAAGTLTILLRLYPAFPVPAYAAVLLCNTVTPVLDSLIAPRRARGQQR